MVLRCGGAVLQDMAVAVADAAADAYLAEAGVSRQGRQLNAMPPARLPACCACCMLTATCALECLSGVTLSSRLKRNAEQRMYSAKGHLHVDRQDDHFRAKVSAGRGQGTRGPHEAAASWLLVLHPRLTTTARP